MVTQVETHSQQSPLPLTGRNQEGFDPAGRGTYTLERMGQVAILTFTIPCRYRLSPAHNRLEDYNLLVGDLQTTTTG